uniref:Uncharacterized protein n=1 Tax=Oryza punctata TaxID=4537 RepID=A0A0E0MB72_ORYPU
MEAPVVEHLRGRQEASGSFNSPRPRRLCCRNHLTEQNKTMLRGLTVLLIGPQR